MSVFTMVTLLWLGLSSAWGATAKVCFGHKVDYYHSEEMSEDYLTDDGVYPAWGAKMEIVCEDCSIPNHQVWAGYLSAEPEESCVELPLVQISNPVGETLSTQHSYRVRLKSKYRINGHEMRVVIASGSELLYGLTKTGVTFDWPVLPVGTTTKFLRTNLNPAWNIATVAGWVLLQYGEQIPTDWYDSSGNLAPAPPFYITDNACGSGAGMYSCTKEGMVHIDDFGGDDHRRTVIAHEFAHAISYRAAERSYLGAGIPWVTEPNGYDHEYEWWDYDATEDGCTSGFLFHDIVSKEYHNAAYVEGFANFVAALALNDPEEFGGNAEIQSHVGVDWDYSGTTDTTLVDVQDRLHSSLDLTAPAYAPYINYDHLTTGINQSNQCSGTRTGRATEYDYTRFLWDLYLTSEIDLTTLLDIFEASEPDKWHDEAGLPISDPDHPVALLQAAADAQPGFVGTTWLGLALIHGVAE